ncbi:MAG TPA: nitroreductase family protein [Acidimicrobiales bacterium]|jgi:nitroreductase|nr:nitroreductase family protein [Acidimicrobiales bacterium]
MGEPFDLSQTDELLTTTRAVRKRLDFSRPVAHELLLECVRIASQAPSGGAMQITRWVFVEDAAKRVALADLYRRAYQPYIAEQKRTIAASGHRVMDKIVSSSDYLAEHLHEVPVHLVPCALGRPEGAIQGSVAGFYGSILPAVWSFMLAARSRGLGTAWTTLHLAYEKEAAELLEIPSTVTQVALVPVAYYTGEGFRPGSRRPAEEIAYLNAWKQPF